MNGTRSWVSDCTSFDPHDRFTLRLDSISGSASFIADAPDLFIPPVSWRNIASLRIAAFRRLSVLSMFLSERRTCFGLCRFCAVISGKCGKRGMCGSAKSISYVLSIWTVGTNPSLSAITFVI